VLGQVTPAVFQAMRPQQFLQVSNAVARVGGHDIMHGIIAGIRPAIILEEDDIMTEAPEAHQVLQMVPTVAAERVTNQVSRADDVKLHRSLNASRFACRLLRPRPGTEQAGYWPPGSAAWQREVADSEARVEKMA